MVNLPRIFVVAVLLVGTGSMNLAMRAQPASAPASGKPMLRQKVILDTDIGDDVDDVFAVGLALSSSELEMVGITSAWGDTKLRARMLDRLLRETGRGDIPVAVGIERHKTRGAAFSQAGWAQREPDKHHLDAVDFLLEQIKKYPGEITLIAIAPQTNLGAAIAREPETFKKLKRIVMMGGAVRVGYDDRAPLLLNPPGPEYNIAMDIPAAQAVFASGVPIYLMPLDSTQLSLNEGMRQLVFTQSTPLTDAFALLYLQWSRATKRTTPTMFDAMAVAYAIDPRQCAVTPLHIEVNSEGVTEEKPGQANAYVCLSSNSDSFFRFFLQRLLSKSAVQ